MATISEIFAARAAAAKAAAATTQAHSTPAGKQEGRPAAPVLNSSLPANTPTDRSVPIEDAPKIAEPVRRSLSGREGEAFPMLPAAADQEEMAWHAVGNAFETELCVMRDPVDLEACWLAIRPARPSLTPVLLHRLPWLLWEHPATYAPTPAQPAPEQPY